jgi:hypothetical protein
MRGMKSTECKVKKHRNFFTLFALHSTMQNFTKKIDKNDITVASGMFFD